MTEKILECDIERIVLVEPLDEWETFLDEHDVPYELVDPDDIVPDTEMPRIDIHYEDQEDPDTYTNGALRAADYITLVLAEKYHGDVKSTI